MTSRVQTAAKMLDTRDTLRGLLGFEQFKLECAQYEPLIRGVMAHDHCSELDAALRLIKLMQKKHDSDMSQMMVLATAVEMIEPSEQPT